MPNARLAERVEPTPAEPCAGSFDDFIRGQYQDLAQFLRRRTSSAQDAEDAARESLTRMLRYRDSEPASAWQRLLFRIAINVAHDQHRLEHSHHARGHVEHTVYDTGSIQRFLNRRFGLAPLPGIQQRDAAMREHNGFAPGDLTETLDLG